LGANALAQLVLLLQLNGMSYTGNGLKEFDLTSGDQAARSARSSSSHQLHATSSFTQQLEQKNVPPDIATTLEHIVGQLDILTQVNIDINDV